MNVIIFFFWCSFVVSFLDITVGAGPGPSHSAQCEHHEGKNGQHAELMMDAVTYCFFILNTSVIKQCVSEHL